MPDITPGRKSLEQSAALPPENDPGSVRAVITRGWNAYMVQVALKQNGVTRRLVGKEATSCLVAGTVARVFAATRGVPWKRRGSFAQACWAKRQVTQGSPDSAGLEYRVSHTLKDLAAAGVATWLDDLSRTRVISGDLLQMVTAGDIVGITTNPTIFSKSISARSGYEDQLRELALSGTAIGETLRLLTAWDVRAACGVFATRI